ncbi:MAG: hypothetical protein JOY61_19645 [Chloroflexi bacterium]|nr:hypothetical protein [Chloroflexota bacterium]
MGKLNNASEDDLAQIAATNRPTVDLLRLAETRLVKNAGHLLTLARSPRTTQDLLSVAADELLEIASAKSLADTVGSVEQVAPSPESVAKLGTDMGLTAVEGLQVECTAVLNAGRWHLRVLRLIGQYSLQARLVGNQTQLTGTGDTTRDNYIDQLAGLMSHGLRFPDKQSWYVVEAVERHEAVHASRILPSLLGAEIDPSYARRRAARLFGYGKGIRAIFETLSVPDEEGMTPASAVAAIKQSTDYGEALAYAKERFVAFYDVTSLRDHGMMETSAQERSPTWEAEAEVVAPLIAAIAGHARRQGWPMEPLDPFLTKFPWAKGHVGPTTSRQLA